MGIKVENLTYIYNKGMPFETKALEDVSFSIADGEFVGIIGHTGSGKSTLLQHLNGLIRPTEGRIFVGDVDITEEGVALREIRKKVGLVFQYPEYQLFEETVRADVAFGPMNLGLSPETVERRTREALEMVGFDYDEIAEKSPFELSGGQKRRVAIAGVIAMKPEVLILDEPTAGLDPKAHREFLKLLEKIHREEKNILILVSHNMQDIADMCDKVMVLDRGRCVMMGAPEEVFANRDELKSLGLSVPPISEVIYLLKEAGFEALYGRKLEGALFSVDEVAEAIAGAMNGGRHD